MKREFTSKDLHIELKRGKGIEFMMQKYGFKNEQELFEAIRKIMPNGPAEKIINKLNRTSRKGARREKAMDSQEKKNLSATNNGQGENEQNNSASETHSSDRKAVEAELQRLSRDEAELSRWLCKLEAEHKSLVQERNTVFDSLRSAKQDCQTLLDRIKTIKAEVESYRKKYEDISKEMSKYNSDIGAAREILQDVRNKMSRLRIISIFIYEDGKIELEGSDNPEILESNINSVFDALIKRPDAEELTIKSVKSLAQLILIVKKLQEVGANFELYFDNSKVQDYYNLIAKEFSL